MQQFFILKKIWGHFKAFPKIDIYGWLVRRNSVVIHASCVVVHDVCFIFLGNSGFGKTTLARLFYERFGKGVVFNDDRIVIQQKRRDLFVYGTPWVGRKTSAEGLVSEDMCAQQVVSSKTHRIYFFYLKKSLRNSASKKLLLPVRVKLFIQGVLGNHVFLRHDFVDLDSADILDVGLTPYAKKAYKRSVRIVEDLAKKIPIRQLQFKKSASVVDYLLRWARHEMAQV